MPLYDFCCTSCSRTHEVTMRLSDFKERAVLFCPDCRRDTAQELLIRPPHVEDWGNCGDGRFFEHLGPTGVRFRDKRSYTEHLKRNGLVEWSPKTGMPGSGI